MPARGSPQVDSQQARGADRRRWSAGKSSGALIFYACQSWRSYRPAIGLLLLATFGCSPRATSEAADGSRHLFVWALGVDKGADVFLSVVEVDRRSATFGQVVRT